MKKEQSNSGLLNNEMIELDGCLDNLKQVLLLPILHNQLFYCESFYSCWSVVKDIYTSHSHFKEDSVRYTKKTILLQG